MKRLVFLALLASLLGAAPVHAATKTYSTGTIRLSIPASGTVERAIRVGEPGPVSYVDAALRISYPDTGDLTLSLISPTGVAVPLAVRRGHGADFGTGNGCRGQTSVFDADSDKNAAVAKDKPPFTNDPHRADGNLARFYNEDARGRWRLRIENAGTATGALTCFMLTLSRAVPTTISATKLGVTATETYVERNYFISKARFTVARHGKAAFDASFGGLGCRDCPGSRPTDVTIRDLDGGEPEVIFGFFTNGAHCCSDTAVLRWDGSGYQARVFDWGNYGYVLKDYDHDGIPEFAAYDEAFVYAYTSYADSAAPPQIWHYEQGKLVDVTRNFPTILESAAAQLLASYNQGRRTRGDLRGIAAAYAATLYLLDRSDEANAWLDHDAARRDFSSSQYSLGPPYGAKFVAKLEADLLRLGYA